MADGAWRRIRRKDSRQCRRPRHGKFRAPRKSRCAHGSGHRCKPACPWPPEWRRPPPGIGLVRPMEAAARKAGVQILLKHRMTGIMRESQTSGQSPWNYGHEPGQDREHSREEGRNRRHRRPQQQREFPQDFRSAADRRVPGGRRAVFVPGRQRRDCGHGHRRVALGRVQPDRRIWPSHHQSGKNRLPEGYGNLG